MRNYLCLVNIKSNYNLYEYFKKFFEFSFVEYKIGKCLDLILGDETSSELTTAIWAYD